MRATKLNVDIKSFGLFLVLGAVWVIALRVIGFDGLYGQDAYEYIRQAKEIKQSLLSLSKPPDFYWAPGYPFLIAIIDFLIGDLVTSAGVLSALCWSLTLFVLWKFCELFKNNNDLFNLLMVLVIVGFSAYFFRISFTIMSDGLTTLLVTLSLYYFEKNRLEKAGRAIVWSTLFACLGILTRYAAFPFVAIILAVGVIRLIQHKHWLSFATVCITMIGFGFLFLFLKESSPDQILKHSIVSDWSIINFWSSSIQNNQGSMSYPFPNILYVFYPISHLGFIWIFIPLVIYGAIKGVRITSKTVAFAIFIYLIFLAGIPFQNKRFLVLVIPAIFIILIPFLESIERSLGKKQVYLIGLLLLVSNLSLTINSFNKVYSIQQKEVAICNEVKKRKIDTLYTFEVDQALKYRGLGGTVSNLWLIDTVIFKKDNYFLLNRKNWENQWKHHQLMKNVNYILDNKRVILIDTLEYGWTLWKYE